MATSIVLLLVFSLFGRVGVARAYGLDAWGQFSLGLALTGLLSLVALLGLNQAIARSISYESDPGERRALIRWGLLITAVAAVVVSTLVYVLAPYLASLFGNSQLTIVFRLFSTTIGFQMMAAMIASVFQGFEDSAPNAWFNSVAAPGLFVVFLLGVLYFHWGFYGALIAYTASQGVTLVLLVVYLVRRLPRYLPAVEHVPARPRSQLWTLSVALWGVASLQFVTAYVDTLILGAFRSTETVGLYSGAMTLARLLLVGNGALTYIYMPTAARLVALNDRETIRRTFVTATRWTLVITVPMFLLFFCLPTWSLTEVFKGSFAGGALALQILVLGSFFSVTLGPVNACLAGMGYARPLLVVTGIAASANIVLSFGLIPTYGLIGASLAWTVARCLYPGVGLAYLYTADRVTPYRRILVVPVVATVAIGLPAFLLIGRYPFPHWIVFPLYFAGVGLFLAVLVLSHSLDPGDAVMATVLERIVRRPLPGLRRLIVRYSARTDPVSTPLVGAG
ncbi:MAG: oligosaccharide flippase family protein [Thermoplasmata archaeon]|nr:oligosaccharide flippase family protein [Thermoplasmata archaeon]MCI4356011.1 oligosaccharide flippase family protein [Thermoplasmata archaeon]